MKEKGRQIKLVFVESGEGEIERSMEIAKQIAERNYRIEMITPREAKKIGLKPNYDIIPIEGLFPETHQYYPNELVEPSRKIRREREPKKNKKKYGW